MSAAAPQTAPGVEAGPTLLLGPGSFAQSALPPASAPYRDAKLPVEQRVADLLARMTIEETVYGPTSQT